MKPHRFEYASPVTVEEAIGLHSDYDVDSVLLAGGQSLVPLLNMRMAMPELVIDLNRIEGLGTFGLDTDSRLRIGAMARQRAVERDPVVAERFPILIEALDHVAHVGVRTRGTVGGSICHAEPAAELPAVMVTLGAEFTVQGPGGSRTIPAADFYLGPMTTVIEEGEILTEIAVPAPPPGSGTSFLEVARTHGAFALVGVAALLHCDGEGRIDHVGLSVCGVSGTPLRPSWLEEVMVGEEPSADLFESVARRVSEEVEPMSDGHADSEYRRRVAGTLVARALSSADQRQNGKG